MISIVTPVYNEEDNVIFFTMPSPVSWKKRV